MEQNPKDDFLPLDDKDLREKIIRYQKRGLDFEIMKLCEAELNQNKELSENDVNILQSMVEDLKKKFNSS